MQVSLALGGGGSRGYAHIGVLRVLERNGVTIQAVAGTSAGGIVAVAYANGLTPDEMENIFVNVDQTKLFARSPTDGPGILGLTGAERLFETYFGHKTFADLHIPCAVAAVDLKSCKEVVINHGILVEALLATIAVPGVFPPRQIGNTQLVDGAVLNPVPVSIAKILAPNIPVVAVVLNSRSDATSIINSLPIPVPVPGQIVERISRTRVARAFNIFLQSVDIASRNLAETRLRIDNPEVIIRPKVGEIGMLDKVDVRKIARTGEYATEKAMPSLRKVFGWQNRARRRLGLKWK